MKYLILLSYILLLNFSNKNEEIFYSRKIEKKESKIEINQDSIYNYSVSIIKKYEGYRSQKYIGFNDLYIGYGHKVKKSDKDTSLTEIEAENVLKCDLNKFLINIETLAPGLDYDKKMLLALLCYNCKMHNLIKRRIFILITHNAPKRMIQREYYDYCHIQGEFSKRLLQRRIDEFKICL